MALRVWINTTALLALGVAMACGDDQAGSNEDSAGTSASEDGSSGVGSETGTGSGDESDGGADSGSTGDVPKLDVGAGTGTSGGEPGCKKVDFLFVIDDSGSMRDEQENLVAAFPGFIAAINANVEGMDHHIMVIDSDESPAWLCEEFLSGAHCQGTNEQPDCGNYPCGSIDMLGPCDTTLGAGVVAPYGGYASNMDCGFPAGRRYLTDQDADLESLFGCAATVGISGNGDEFPMTAAVDAVGTTLGAGGACNEGFLRDDAILVVTLVSDDLQSMYAPGDDASAGDPSAWYSGLVAAKGDNADAIVFIGIVAYDDVSCVFPMEEATRFVELVQMFGDNGVLSSVCADDYAGVFGDSIAVIDTTCEEFEPEG